VPAVLYRRPILVSSTRLREETTVSNDLAQRPQSVVEPPRRVLANDAPTPNSVIVILAIVGTVALVLAAGLYVRHYTSTMRAHGQIEILPGHGTAADFTATSSGCQGRGTTTGDLTPGAKVVVTDTAGSVVGTGSLDQGHLVHGECVLLFSARVPKIPAYQLSIAGHPPVAFTEAGVHAGMVLSIESDFR
jgi:hypothetical protein